MKKIALKKQEKLETKADKFARLAMSRVNRVTKAIHDLGNLSVRANYDYTGNDIERIEKAINQELTLMFQRFQNGGKSTAGFTL